MLEIKAIYFQNTALLEQIDFHKQKIQEYLADKSIPLEKRWENYLLLPEQFSEDSWFTGFSEYDSPYDDFYMDRGTTKMGKHLVENVGPAYKEDYNPDKVDRLKEEILQSGHTSFCFDW